MNSRCVFIWEACYAVSFVGSMQQFLASQSKLPPPRRKVVESTMIWC